MRISRRQKLSAVLLFLGGVGKNCAVNLNINPESPQPLIAQQGNGLGNAL
jgi:predicted NodU family carbamoyl transferase